MQKIVRVHIGLLKALVVFSQLIFERPSAVSRIRRILHLFLFQRREIWIGDQEPELPAPICRVHGFRVTFDHQFAMGSVTEKSTFTCFNPFICAQTNSPELSIRNGGGVSNSRGSISTFNEMPDDRDHRDYEKDVNQSTSHREYKEAQGPEND
jgi:hypothetical protein